jgi:hypothetical protein
MSWSTSEEFSEALNAEGIPNKASILLASSAVLADVTKVTFMPC